MYDELAGKNALINFKNNKGKIFYYIVACKRYIVG